MATGYVHPQLHKEIVADLETRLEKACEELIALKAQNEKQRKEIERLALLVHESVELETFWKRCAEQAMRLWENSQDMRDELCKLVALCSTIEAVHELLDDELNA